MTSAHPLAIERHQLDNGLRVVLQPDSELPLVAINLWYHVGSKNESPSKTGFAHLFEHMLFQGSQHVGTNDHFAHIQNVGGTANGSTSRDRTNYYETLPSNHLELGLWLESDRMGFLLPAMTSEKLENQRQVVMNERRQRVDNQPYGLAHERLWELLFPGDHPYHWPIIGYMEDIEAATLEEVHHFFKRWYRPNNAVLTLAGDFEPATALELVQRYFADIHSAELHHAELHSALLPAPSQPAPDASNRTDAKIGEQGSRRIVLEDDIHLPRVYLAFHVPAYGDAEWYVADLLTTVLGDGKSSPLYDQLVQQRQIAQSASAWIHETERSSVVMISATGRPGVEGEALEAALREQLERLAGEPPAQADMDRALNRTRTRAYSDLQSLGRRAYTTYFDRPELLGHEVERYLEIGAEELCQCAARLLADERQVVVIVIPKQSSHQPSSERPQ